MTVGQTRIQLSKVIEHALRRCGVSAVMQTPEIVQISKDNLHFILSSWANRGLPLWCVEDYTATIDPYRANYVLPTGTIDVITVNRRLITVASGTDTVLDQSVATEFEDEARPLLVGIKATAGTLTYAIDASDDGSTWEEIQTGEETISANTRLWISIDGALPAGFYRVRELVRAVAGFTSVYWVNSYTDVPMSAMSRQEYSQLPNRHSPGTPVQYLLDRQLTPELNLWPVAEQDDFLLNVFLQRDVADVSNLRSVLEIPKRWYDATIWQLADRLAVEIPGIDPNRAQMVAARAQAALIEVEAEEVDHAPVHLQPDIGVYTQ